MGVVAVSAEPLSQDKDQIETETYIIATRAVYISYRRPNWHDRLRFSLHWVLRRRLQVVRDDGIIRTVESWIGAS